MRHILLKSIHYRNYKSIEDQTILFGPTTKVSGMNGSGKSSLLDGYFFALTGKDADGRESNIIPTDTTGKILPKVNTFVEVTFDVDSEEHTVKRECSQKWVVRNNGYEDVEIYTGSTYPTYIDGAKYGTTAFSEKIKEVFGLSISDIELLTTDTKFNQLDWKDRRSILISMAGDVENDLSIAQRLGLHEVVESFRKGKDLDTLLSQTRTTRTDYEKRRELIPTIIESKIEERTNIDFEQIQNNLTIVTNSLRGVEDQLKATKELVSQSQSNAIRNKIEDLNQQIAEIDRSLIRERSKKLSDLNLRLKEAEQENKRISVLIATKNRTIGEAGFEIERQSKLKSEAISKWKTVNESQFSDDAEKVCPHCGKPYTSEELSNTLTTLIANYNNWKIGELRGLKAIVENCNTAISAQQQIINQENAQELPQKVDEAIIRTNINLIPTLQLLQDSNKERVSLLTKISEYHTAIKQLESGDVDFSSLEQDKLSYQNRIAELNRTLGKHSINESIDMAIVALQSESKDLSQKIADCLSIENQIKIFYKEKVSTITSNIDNLFTKVKWELFKENTSNDGYQPCCECTVDGIAYTGRQLNTGSKIEAGVDIVHTLSNHYGVNLPLWIDNYESLSSSLHSPLQLITLSVSNEPLTINN